MTQHKTHHATRPMSGLSQIYRRWSWGQLMDLQASGFLPIWKSHICSLFFKVHYRFVDLYYHRFAYIATV